MFNYKATLSLLALLLSLTCTGPTNNDGEGAPLLPSYLNVTLNFEELPGYLEPAELVFEAAVIGDSGNFVTTWEGDTLGQLWLSFVTSDWVEAVGFDPDSLWSGPYEIGQIITLRPVFQHTKGEEVKFWTSIGLVGTFYPSNVALPISEVLGHCPFTVATLSFENMTGAFSFKNPYDVWHSRPPGVQ